LNQKYEIMKQPMERAPKVARENLKKIRTVTEWAKRMGYDSPKYFSKRFKEHYGEPAKSELVEIRLNVFQNVIRANPELSCYEIGQLLGLGDENNLNEYIIYHTKFSPTWWRNQELK